MMGESIRLRHRLDGGIEFHGVEFDEVGEEMIFHFLTDDELIIEADDPEDFLEDIA